jgi:integrase
LIPPWRDKEDTETAQGEQDTNTFEFIAREWHSEWNIPASKMKMNIAHLVPLPLQAIEILQELKPMTGHSKYVFPGHRSPLRCLSDVALNAALRRMGFEKSEITTHGFRAMARTILDEVLQVRADFIEHQLAHAVKDTNGRAHPDGTLRY